MKIKYKGGGEGEHPLKIFRTLTLTVWERLCFEDIIPQTMT